VNCSEADIHLEDTGSQVLSLLDLTIKARALRRSDSRTDDAMEELAKYADPSRSGHLSHAVQTFHAQKRPLTVAYMPAGMQSGGLDGANPLQILLCRWLESGPVCEADGLWIQGGPGFGKTTAMKLLCLRYPGQIYFAAVRAVSNDYDRTAFNGYRPEHRVVVFNDVKLKKPNSTLFSTLREATDGLVLETVWGTREISVTVEAKIVVNSTSALPDDLELRRRFSSVENDNDGAVRTKHSNPVGLAGGKRVKPADGGPRVQHV